MEWNRNHYNAVKVGKPSINAKTTMNVGSTSDYYSFGNKLNCMVVNNTSVAQNAIPKHNITRGRI